MSALIQQTQEWLDFRKKMIGASDAPIIMEVSPWKTSYQLWLEKLDLIPSTFKSNAMSRGLQLESSALAKFCLITGIVISPKVIIHPTISYMMASMDGITEDGKHAVEIKCPGEKDHTLAAQGKVPEKYYPQLQHQMEVCGLDKMYYFSFDTHSHFLIEVQRDEKYLKTLLQREKEFYECLQNFVAPTCDDSAIIRNDDIWSTLAKDWLDVQTQLAALERREEVLRESLSAIAGDHATKGAGIRVSKATRKGAIEYTKVPQLGGIDLEPYRKESVVYWKISAE
jgi:putative phage-type endonuclease